MVVILCHIEHPTMDDLRRCSVPAFTCCTTMRDDAGITVESYPTTMKTALILIAKAPLEKYCVGAHKMVATGAE